MKLATYNVNGIKSRLPQLMHWLERESPDVVCLQELKAVDSASRLSSCAVRATTHCGRASAPGTAWRFCRASASRSKSGARCPATRPMNRLAI
jgi:exonuclease III